MIQIELRPEVEARLTAEAQARGVEVQTLNQPDFVRYTSITVVQPKNVSV